MALVISLGNDLLGGCGFLLPNVRDLGAISLQKSLDYFGFFFLYSNFFSRFLVLCQTFMGYSFVSMSGIGEVKNYVQNPRKKQKKEPKVKYSSYFWALGIAIKQFVWLFIGSIIWRSVQCLNFFR